MCCRDSRYFRNRACELKSIDLHVMQGGLGLSTHRPELKPQHAAAMAAWLNLVANVVLMLGKGIIGTLAGSRALVADAVHSAADLAGSIAVMIGLRVARKPPDAEHPYGHGKAELVSSAVVAVLLIVAALRVGTSGILALGQHPQEPEWIAGYAAAVAIVIKAVLYRYNMHLGRRLHSQSLIASALDHRSDVLSSAAALVGICVSILGKKFHIHWMLYGDALSSALVAVLVLRVGFQVAVEAVHTLMDRVVPKRESDPYHTLILEIDGVKRIDELRARDHGQYVIVDVKISVDAEMTVARGHDVAERVKERMCAAFPRVRDVLVHVNPYYD